jgi:ankyrin repeat protein
MPSHPKSHIPDNKLQSYAMAGNAVDVKSALDAGADVNALDVSGRTALMCAIAGEE